VARATVGPGSVVRCPTAIVVELGQDALGEGPPEVNEPDELGWKQTEESELFSFE